MKVRVASHVDELDCGSVTGKPVPHHPYRGPPASCNRHDAIMMLSSGPLITHAIVMGGEDLLWHRFGRNTVRPVRTVLDNGGPAEEDTKIRSYLAGRYGLITGEVR